MNTSTCNLDSKTPGPVLGWRRPVDSAELRRRAEWIRLETIRLIDGAGLGHYSSTFSCAELYAVLYYRTMRLCPTDPQWADRDRLILGKGHAAVGLWPVLADLGFFPKEWLGAFGKIDAALTDHPNMRVVPGIDFSSGALGHNLSVATGMLLASRLRGSDHRVYVITGDGELHEGQIWEAAMAASHFGLGNLVVIVDANGSCADGPTSQVLNIEPIAGRFGAFGWNSIEVDGHDVPALTTTLDQLPPPDSSTPTCVVARTLKGKGVSFMEQSPRDWHLGYLGAQDRVRAEDEIKARMS